MAKITQDLAVEAQREAQYTYTATFIQEGLTNGHPKLRFHVPLRQAVRQEPVQRRREKAKDVTKSRNPTYRQVSFWIPKELLEAVKIRLIEEGVGERDQSDLFADALRSYLSGRGGR